jgi:alpha-N-acetylglucosamine transferase
MRLVAGAPFSLRELVLALSLILSASLLFFRSPSQLYSASTTPDGYANVAAPPAFSSQGTLENPTSKYAYAVYLAPTAEEDAGEDPKAEDDVYFTSVRMLIYQLQHDPETRTTNSIPLVVLVAPEVSQSKRKRLEAEGAMIAEFPSIHVDTLQADRPRWKHVMDKLNVFKLTQFEKVLLLDCDIVLFRPLDALFEEPETQMRYNLNAKKNTKDDEGPQPKKYILAADASPLGGDTHPYPAERAKALNAGFMVLHPSLDMFDHLLKIAAIEGRTPMKAPENNLLEYVHRADGNMPFYYIKNTWIMNHPIFNDYEQGIAAVHEKWYRNSLADKKLRDVLLRVRWKMDGYWNR